MKNTEFKIGESVFKAFHNLENLERIEANVGISLMSLFTKYTRDGVVPSIKTLKSILYHALRADKATEKDVVHYFEKNGVGKASIEIMGFISQSLVAPPAEDDFPQEDDDTPKEEKKTAL